MEQDANNTPIKVGLKYGIILGVAMSVISLVFHYAGLNDNPADPSMTNAILTTGVTWVILFTLFYMGIKNFKDGNDGHLTFGEGLVTALFIGLISGIISAIFSYVLFTYIAPELAGSITEAAMEGAREGGGGDLDEDGEEMMNSMMSTMTSPGVLSTIALVTRIVTAAIFGIIATLIQKTE